MAAPVPDKPPATRSALRQPPVRILGGLIIGLVAGALAAGSPAEAPLAATATPIGKLWLDALTMTVVPLVTALLVTGVFDAGNQGGNAIARRALGWFVGLLVAASLLGGIVTLGFLDLWPLPEAAARLIDAAGPAPVLPSGSWVESIIPTNIVRAAADTAMVPLVIFAVLFGFALTRIDRDSAEATARLFRGIAAAMLVIIGWVLWVAPLGVLALAFIVGTKLGAGAAGVLAHYVAVIVGVCLATAAMAHLLGALAGRVGIMGFARAAVPAQAIAMSTQSSLASLPAMVAAAQPLAVSAANAGIVLPLAVAMFRAASAAANMGVAIYLADLHGVAVTPATFVIGALVAAAVSLGAVGLPAQVSFFAVIAPVCVAMGVPTVLLPLLLAIETIPDIFRTLGNVTADLAVMRLAGRTTGAPMEDPLPHSGPRAEPVP
ncbi:cation:dicarboxylase symporter family transporter [Polymorphobacter fuscus]|uniref:Cation:dicarboxylase symporter family transporter n=2 Tax=Sandarakinorhabdus fusca TaxID=1439888 RepID=A0A7C9GRI6_9SPHN|nr:dicarboxylate/amino acid:cation symporter [Polymorphobacter fuscus]MQT18593.1 cation:dicarboxylase symporter family transporter [Polymorphobacter fuscus]